MQMRMLERYKSVMIWVLIAVLTSCGGYEYEEIARAINTDGTVDAIAVNLLTGATVATPTKVYVEKRGSEVEGSPILVADYVEDLTIAWDGDERLVIRARQARVFSFVDSVSVKTSKGLKKIFITLEIEKRS